MVCNFCKKKWFCITACPEVNSELTTAYEALPEVSKMITWPWNRDDGRTDKPLPSLGH